MSRRCQRSILRPSKSSSCCLRKSKRRKRSEHVAREQTSAHSRTRLRGCRLQRESSVFALGPRFRGDERKQRVKLSMWRASVLTIFPEMFPGPLAVSLAGKALAGGIWSLAAIDIRDHTTDRHRTVDDTPAGGGPGMVMRADVLARALDSLALDTAANDKRPRLLMSPRGTPLTQARVAALANGPGVSIVCGRFEGVDERLIAARQLEEVSLGDFVLSGGEIAALALIDACVRLLPGVMGHAGSGTEESFSEGLLEYPHYTRPQEFEGRTIPDVLTSGNHKEISAWRRREAEQLTRQRRPDLLAKSQKPQG